MQCELFPEFEQEKYDELERRYNDSLRKIKNSKDEMIFRNAQEHYEKNKDLKSWQTMYLQIRKACFMALRKKTKNKIDYTILEGYADDITLNIMSNLSKKIAHGEFWKIEKLSSFVFLPCLAIFQKQRIFEDSVMRILDIKKNDEDKEDFLNQDFKQENGFLTKKGIILK